MNNSVNKSVFPSTAYNNNYNKKKPISKSNGFNPKNVNNKVKPTQLNSTEIDQIYNQNINLNNNFSQNR